MIIALLAETERLISSPELLRVRVWRKSHRQLIDRKLVSFNLLYYALTHCSRNELEEVLKRLIDQKKIEEVVYHNTTCYRSLE